MPSAGLIYGPEFHHLDHLAPLCSLLEIPLILTDPEITTQAQTFYPNLNILHWGPHQAPEKLLSQFDTIFYSIPRILFEEIFFFAQALHQKRIRTIWCPHGNSDKGRDSPFMEGLKEEEHLLTYGPRIEAFLKEKGITAPMTRIGNYRLAYYEKHKAFYDNLVPKKSGPTLLYAPTWQDQEENSSFPTLWPHLLKTPSHLSLIIKLHPNLYHQFPEEIETLREKAPKNVTLLENFSPIYPILAQADLYIGDKSSIGYDFLAFKKPMLFLIDSDLAQGKPTLSKENYTSLFTTCETLLNTAPEEDPLYTETYSRADMTKALLLMHEGFSTTDLSD